MVGLCAIIEDLEGVMTRLTLVLAAGVVSLLPTGAARAPFQPAVACPMPVRVPDSTAVERMPVVRVNTAVPMPTQLPRCSNPLAARGASATSGELPDTRELPSRR